MAEVPEHLRTEEPAPSRAPRGAGGLWSVPNLLSAVRLGMVPVLWGLALLDRPVAVGIGWAVAGSTDLVDGFLARRAHEVTPLGSTLDSVADHTLSASGLAWLLMLRPELFREQRVPLALWMALALCVLLVSLVKFRRPVDLHLYSGKAAGFLGTLFGISLLVLGGYSPAVFYVVLGAAFLATTEALLILLTRSRVDEHIGSIFRRR